MIGNFDDTGHVFSLFKQPDGTPSQSSGSIVLAKGPDYPSNGMTGSLVNMESPYGWDADSQSYKFDNVNDFVQTDPKVNSNTLTLSMFAKLNGANNYGTFYFYGDTTNIRAYIRFNNQLYVDTYLNSSTRLTASLDIPTEMSDGTWFNLTVVYDMEQATPELKLKIYINGTQCSATFIYTALTEMPDLSEFNLSVGGRDDKAQTLNGEIKLFSLFKTAKSDTEILELYDLGPDLGGLKLKADGTLYSPLCTNSIVVSPPSAKVAFNKTKQFRATALDLNSDPVNSQPTFEWSTDIGSIDQTGLLTAPNTEGTGTVTASADGVSGTASVRVVDKLSSNHKIPIGIGIGF